MWERSEEGSEIENDEQDAEFSQYFKPSYVVIAIDTHPSMFVKNKHGSLPFRDCLGACYALADSLVLKVGTRSWIPFAVVLTNNIGFIDFKDNVLDTVKLLKSKLDFTEEQLRNEFMSKEDLELSNFLLACKKVFQKVTSPFYKRVLLYVTNDDDPVPAKFVEKRFKAFNEIKTFPACEINFQMASTKENFDYKLFYNELFSLIDAPTVIDFCEDQDGLEEKLLSIVKVKRFRNKMKLYPFKDDHTRYIKCISMDPIHTNTLLNTTVTKNGKKVKKNEVTIDDLPKYVVKCSSLGKTEEIEFDLYEHNNLHDNTLPVGFTLLYVCKRITDIGFVISKPRLIQEDADETSTYFKKFWQCCVAGDRILVCAMKFKKFQKMQYAELIPTTVNDSPAFLCKRIPFATEIVMPFKHEYPEPDRIPERKKLFEKLVDKLTFNFDLNMIPDPCFSKKKEYLKAKLLERPMAEVTNVTFNKETLDEHLRDTVDQLNSAFVFGNDKKRKVTSRAPYAKKKK